MSDTYDNNSFLEGNGIIILILFLLFAGNGWGGFGGNNASTQGAVTRAELQDGLNAQNTFSEFRSIQNDITNGFAATTNALTNGFNGVQIGMNNGFNGVQSAIADSRYAMQNCCCELKSLIRDESAETRALIQANTVQDLRDKIADKDRDLQTTGLAAAILNQTNNLENFIRSITGNSCSCS